MSEKLPRELREWTARLDRAVPPHAQVIDDTDGDPVLDAARRLARGPRAPLSASALNRIETRLRKRHVALHQSGRRPAQRSSRVRSTRPFWAGVKRTLRYAAAVLLTLVLVTSGLTAASASSLPGDTLYTFKLGVEEIRLTLVSDDGEPGLRINFAERRLDEFATLLNKQIINPHVLEEATAQMNRALTLLASGYGNRNELDPRIAELTYEQATLIQHAAASASPEEYSRLQVVSEWNNALFVRVVAEGTFDPNSPVLATNRAMVPTLPDLPTPPVLTPDPIATATPEPANASSNLAKPDRTPPGHGATPGLGLGREKKPGQEKEKNNNNNKDKNKDK